MVNSDPVKARDNNLQILSTIRLSKEVKNSWNSAKYWSLVKENWRLRQNLALSYRLFDDLSLNEVTIIPDDVSLISLTTSSLLFWVWFSLSAADLDSLCLSFPLFCPISDRNWFTKLWSFFLSILQKKNNKSTLKWLLNNDNNNIETRRTIAGASPLRTTFN